MPPAKSDYNSLHSLCGEGHRPKPVIGVTPMYDGGKERYSLRGDYMQMLCGLDALPVMLPLTTDRGVLDGFLDLCDGLILSGGYDVDPVCYGETDRGLCGTIQPERDEMEIYLCRKAVARDIPTLGICRGLQVLNVALGGTLYQDVRADLGTELLHQVSDPVGGIAHCVTLVPGSPLARLQGTAEMPVNSRHHQAIRDAAPGLQIQATAPDGVIESVWMPGKRFVWGVQWHPETIWDLSQPNRKITDAFLAAAREK